VSAGRGSWYWENTQNCVFQQKALLHHESCIRKLLAEARLGGALCEVTTDFLSFTFQVLFVLSEAVLCSVLCIFSFSA
jgi:hypothetical protein